MPTRVKGGSATANVRASVVLARVRTVTAPIGVEVGVFTGAMSRALLAKHKDLFLYMVDSWLPAEQQPKSYSGYGDFHSKFSAKRQLGNKHAAVSGTAGFQNRRAILHMSSRDAAEHFDDYQCDFVFLDADHSYEGVMQDIVAWWPKVRRGGWLCGHDYGGWLWGPKGEKQFFGVKRAVDEFAVGLGLQVIPDEDYTFFLQRPT